VRIDTPPTATHKRHRFPAEVIVHGSWLSHRSCLSLRDLPELMAERGVDVAHESSRRWCAESGPGFAAALRRRRPRPGDKGHVDDAQLKINGRRYGLWRAVDQVGTVLDILAQERRHMEAAEICLRRAVEGVGTRPRVLVTGELASSRQAQRRGLPGVEHRRHQGLNNRAENSPRLPRRRERARQRFTSPEPAQRVLSAFEPTRGHCCPRRHLALPHFGRHVRVRHRSSSSFQIVRPRPRLRWSGGRLRQPRG
jgi:putative transposase